MSVGTILCPGIWEDVELLRGLQPRSSPLGSSPSVLFWSATEVMACSSQGKAQEVWGMGVSKAGFDRVQLPDCLLEQREFGLMNLVSSQNLPTQYISPSERLPK